MRQGLSTAPRRSGGAPLAACLAAGVAVSVVALAAPAAQAQEGSSFLTLRGTMQPDRAGTSGGRVPLPGVLEAAGGDEPQVPPASPAYRPVRAPTALDESPLRPSQQPVARLPAPLDLTPARPRPEVLAEEDPWAPIGLRLGTLTVFPSVEVDAGYDSNPRRASTNVEGSAAIVTRGEVAVRSDWSRHELTGHLRGSYWAFPDIEKADRPEADGRLNLRLDATRDTTIDAEARASLTTQRSDNPNLPGGVINQPTIISYGASLGGTHRFNRLALGAAGTFERNVYGDAEFADGSRLDQGYRNYNEYGLRLRAGYEVHPGLVPFVEGIIDRRQYDERINAGGYERSSNGLGARVGSTFEITRLVTGEAAIGHQVRKYDDPRLADLRGPIGELSLIWRPTALTTVRLTGASTLGETTIAGSSGVVNRRATLALEHALRRNLIFTASATVSESDYKGVALNEQGFTGTIGLDWKLTRSLAVRAGFTHERLDSSAPGDDYTANIFLVGLRLQR